jgi:hypothetical protein
MAQSKNRLLSRLVLIGVASAGVFGHQQASAMSSGDVPGLSAAETDTQQMILQLAVFLRAHPHGAAASKAIGQLVALLNSLSPSVRAQMVDAIAGAGGLPEEVATLVGLTTFSTSAVRRSEPYH